MKQSYSHFPFIGSLTATDFYQVLETSDIPPGVINILTGNHLDLAQHASSHMDVNAVGLSEEEITKTIEFEVKKHKRTWCLKNIDWFDTRAEGEMFLDADGDKKCLDSLW